MMFQKKSGFKIVLKAFSPISKKPPLLFSLGYRAIASNLFGCVLHNPWYRYETWGPMCDASTWPAAERMQVSRYVIMTAPNGARIPP